MDTFSSMINNRNKDKEITFAIFFFFAALFCMIAGEHYLEPLYSIDDRLHISTAVSLATDFSLHFEPVHGLTATKFGILTPLVILPFFLFGIVVSALFRLSGVADNTVITYLVYVNSAFITAVMLAVFYRFSRLLKYPRKTAIYATFVLGIATCVMPYSKYISPAPLVTLLTLLSWMWVVKWQKFGKTSHLTGAGVWFGLSLLARLDNLALLPVALLAILYVHLREDIEKRNIILKQIFSGAFIRKCVTFLVPVFAALGIHFIIEYLKYRGEPSGYSGEAFTTNLFTGMYGLLFSAGRGLFIYSPPLVATALVFPKFARRHRLAAFLVIGTLFVKLFVFGKWWGWHGGAVWGSRFLLPLVPLGCLALNEGFLRWRRLPAWIKSVCWAVILGGIYTQINGVLVRPGKISEIFHTMTGGNVNDLNYIPNLSGIAAAPDMIRLGMIDLWFIFWGEFLPGWSAVVIAVILFVIMGISLKVIFSKIQMKSADFSILPETAPERSRRLLHVLIILNLLFLAACYFGVNLNLIKHTEIYHYRNGDEDIITVATRRLAVNRRILNVPDNLESVEMKWEGYINLPLKGEHRFFVKSNGGAVFRIDGETLITSAIDEPQSTRMNRIVLEPGMHTVQLNYLTKDVMQPVIHVYASYPEFGVDRELLSNKNVFTSPPGTFTKTMITIDNYKYLVVILSLLFFGVLYYRETIPVTSGAG